MNYFLIIKKMKIMFEKAFCILIILITFNACQGIKEGLTGQKQTNTDEFLIEKKNPLILPPEFNKLPEPKAFDKKDNQEINLEKILNKQKVITKSKDINSNKSLEKSILEKIKNR
jgi:hypothetical protein